MVNSPKSFRTRLDSIKFEQYEREQHSQGNHRSGKKVISKESEPSQLDKHGKRFQTVTLRRLNYEEGSLKTKHHDGP